jgi:hypothetical protein
MYKAAARRGSRIQTLGPDRWRTRGFAGDGCGSNLLGCAGTQQLDALIFSSPTSPWREVMVAKTQWVSTRIIVQVLIFAKTRFGEGDAVALWSGSGLKVACQRRFAQN